ncbi:MAG: peptidoglycan-binding protein [Hyphomicrobiaceae bacterium]|nr:trypsin-like serine protease [Hyphomicrobiaceae bacterium]
MAQSLVPVAVFGADNRIALPSQFSRIRDAVGVLFNIRSRTVCSAFCVDTNIIATAAHCIYRTVGEKPPRPTDFWFARNYDTVRDYARVAGHETGAAAQNILAGSTTLSTTPPIDATRDWALIKLARPLCAKGVLEIEAATPLDVIKAAKVGQIFHVSYHRDFTQWRPAIGKGCKVERTFEAADWKTIASDFRQPDDLLLHDCDTGGASSGSPLLKETPAGPRVIGINVGTYVQSRVLMQNGEVSRKLASETIANTGVATSAFAKQLAAFRAAEILMTAPQMKELQQRLQMLKLYAGPIDGTYGPELKTAIIAYETRQKQLPTGLATKALLAALQPETATSARGVERKR